MKRIEFIAPVEAMRGNLSGAQKLEYPTDNQGAYEGPAGSVNYARNYSPRFIGAKIARNGKKYFSVRTKTANHLTAKAKKAMALMGGTGAIIASILRSKTAAIYTNLYGAWVKAQELGDTRTFREFLTNHVRQMLIEKAASHHVQVGSFGQDIDNPWITSSENPNVSVSQATLVKFWPELSNGGIVFTVDGAKGISGAGMMFGDLIADEALNILGLSTGEVSGQTYVMQGSGWLMLEGAYVSATDDVLSNGEYVTSTTAPNA